MMDVCISVVFSFLNMDAVPVCVCSFFLVSSRADPKLLVVHIESFIFHFIPLGMFSKHDGARFTVLYSVDAYLVRIRACLQTKQVEESNANNTV